MRTFTTSEWILIALANACGQDKKTWDERIAFARECLNGKGFSYSEGTHPEDIDTAVECWNNFVSGKPTGYGIALDATSSGTQILSMLTTDFTAAKICNLDSPDKRFDMYTYVFTKMKESMPHLEELGVTRDEVKEAIMTALYGSVSNPSKLFGDRDIMVLFFDTIQECMPNVLKWMEVTKYKAAPLSYIEWYMPDCLKVHYRFYSKLSFAFKPTEQLSDAFESAGIRRDYLSGTTFNCFVNFNPALPEGTSARFDKQYYSFRPDNNACDFQYANTEVNRSNMPNMCHAFDSYIARELVRAAKLPQHIRDGGFIKAKGELARVYDAYVRSLLGYWKLLTKQEEYPCDLDNSLPVLNECPEDFLLSFAVFSYLTKETYNSLGNKDRKRIDSLRELLPKKSFDIKPIHDSFAVLPCYANDIRKVALHVYTDIARNAYLFRPYLCKAVGVDMYNYGNMWGDITQQKQDCFKMADIIQNNAEYFIC